MNSFHFPKLSQVWRRFPNRSFALQRSISSSVVATQNEKPLSKNLRESADTVIIGGGIVGTSIAYHLAKQSKQSVVLLEKSELTAGSTWHAAGLITLYHPGINIKNLHWHSMNFYTQIERETGQQVGFHRPGSLRLATTQSRLDEMKYQMARQGWNKAPQKLLTPEECKAICPILDIDNAKVIGGLFNPYDGHIDPYSLTQAIATGARKHGAELYQKAEVSRLVANNDNSWDVHTGQGVIRAKRVVNASGFWAKEVAKMSGMHLPLVPMQHQYLITKEVPEVASLEREIPVIRHLEGSFYLRQERKGLLIGPYESIDSCKPCQDWVQDRVPPGFGKELFDPDLERLQPHLEYAMDLVPSFQNAEIQTVVNGPITYSPDILPMIGPSLQPNMWLAVGFAYGIVHGGGVGKYLADWIIDGEPPYDLNELDCLRYGKWTTTEYSLAKCRESYGMNNAIGFPHEERLGGRPTYRTSGIHTELVQAGAFMGFHSGWEQPDWYSNSPKEKPQYKPDFYRTNWFDAVQKEYKVVNEKVGLCDLTPFAKIKVGGPDARSYLHHLLAGSVPKKGRTTLAHALTNSGKVYAELTVTGFDDGSFLVVTGSGSELHDLRHMKEVARNGQFKVNISNVTDEMGVLGLAGPNSRAVMEKACNLNDNVKDWKFLDAKECTIGGIRCFGIRISYTGELGWELYMPLNDMKPVYQALMENGQEYGIGHFGTFTVNTFRMEKGFKMWGNEMNCDGTILEAGLDAFVRWRKRANFIGKDSLKAQLGQWRQQKVAMLEVENATEGKQVDPEGNESVWLCNRVVGNTTSGCFSPALGKGLVFAYIPAFTDVPGTELEVEIMGQMRKAKVLAGPPVLTQPVREKN